MRSPTLLAALAALLVAGSPQARAESVIVVADEAQQKPAEAADTQQAKPAEKKTVQAKPADQEPGNPDKTDPQKKEEAKPTPAELRERMRRLERELQEARQAFEQQVQKERTQKQQAVEVDVSTIKLADKPTRKQCEDYIGELRAAAKNKRSFSSRDPIVEKLKEVPAEHSDLLVKEMADRTPLRYFANYAMRDIDPETMRSRFVQTLKTNPNNIGIIVMNGWCQDVRPVIIDHMKSADASVSPSWFQAAVEIDEPELYPKLHEITIGSRYASQFIQMLGALPEYDLAHTVNTCWKRAQNGDLNVSHSTLAPLALDYGNVEALGVMVQYLGSSRSYMVSSSTYNVRRTNLLRYIDYRGSNSEIQAWYNANKDKLVFDHLRKRFVIPEDF